MNAPQSPTLLERIVEIVGPKGVITDPGAIAPYVTDQRGKYVGKTALIVRPSNTEEVAQVVALCHANDTPVVPQGGNTSLCGASVPSETGEAILINLSRMHSIRAIDLDNDTITVEAGVILADVQRAAEAADRLFPLSLAAEGSCEIGGNLSTNAGGTAVVRYGNARELTLGLEVVLPDGQIWSGLRGLRKDNTGYDLKQLFIGAEGTLGIITAAVLKLFPRPRAKVTAIVAVPDPAAAVALLRLFRANCGDRVTGFEIMSRFCLDLVFRHIPGMRDPLPQGAPWYVLVELSDQARAGDLQSAFEVAVGEALEQGVALDAAVAQNESQAKAFWNLRENVPEAQRPEGASIKHDISVPISLIAEFIERASNALEQAYPGVRIVAFGHIGDGNMHFNITRPLGESDASFFAKSPSVNRLVHDTAHELNGSISAEHGLGQLKREEIKRYKSPLELEMMRAVKRALDPKGLMNPGKVI